MSHQYKYKIHYANYDESFKLFKISENNIYCIICKEDSKLHTCNLCGNYCCCKNHSLYIDETICDHIVNCQCYSDNIIKTVCNHIKHQKCCSIM